MAVDDFDADLADVTEDGYDTNLDAFGPGSGRGEDVGYRGTGEGIYDAGSDSYYMPSRSNIINSDNYDVGFAMNDQLSRGLSGDVFDPAKVQQYNQIAAGFSSQPLNISNQQIMNNSAMLREQGKGLEDIRVDFVKELGSKEGNAAFGNFLSGAFNVSKMGPYSDPMKTSDIGAFGVGLSSLMGDKTANYPMNNYDLVDLAMKQGNFALSGRDPSEFGSLGGIANQFGRDVSAGAKQVTNQLLSLADGAMSYLSNQGKAGDTVENIVAEQRGKEIAQLEKERLEQGLNKDFEPLTFPTIDRTNVLNNSFMDSGASLATDPNLSSEDIALRRQFSQDIANASNASNTGITALPEAKPFSESINNQEIAAGTKKGSTLTDREQEDTANYADYLNRVSKAKNEYELYDKAMGYLFANRQKDLPKEVQSKQQANLYPKDIVYLNQLAEDESVAREVYNNLLDLGPKRDFTSSNVNIIPDFFNKDGFTLENKYYNNIFTPKQVEEMRNKGYSLQGIDQLRRPQQFPDKKTVSFSDLSDRNKEQYFLNTNLDYGAPIKTPYNVVY